jgi:hypothetical protein
MPTGEAGTAIDTVSLWKPQRHFFPARRRKTLYKSCMARMRATTVRFGTDLWEMLEREAGKSGVSVAQYIRESALARLAYTAGRRGDPDMGFPHTAEDGDGARPIRARMADLAEAAEAVRHQGNQAVRQAERLLEESMRQTDERSAARQQRRQRVHGR